MLAAPYHLTYSSKEKMVGANKKATWVIKDVTEHGVLYTIPKQLSIDSKVTSSMRFRGLYGVPIYSSTQQLSGEFSNQFMLDFIASHKDSKISWEPPRLSLLIADQRGITTAPSLAWNGAQIAFRPGSLLPGTEAGAYALLPELNRDQRALIPFAVDLAVQGMTAKAHRSSRPPAVSSSAPALTRWAATP